VNVLRAAQIDKIVLLSHLQDIALEKSLPSQLYDVDIIVAGGSGTRMGDGNDTLFSGTHVTDTSFDESYPYQTTDKEKNPVLVVNVDGDYKYLGRLVVNFDQNGVIQSSSLDSKVNGAYAATSTVVSSVGGTAISSVTTLQTAIKSVVDAAYDNTTSNTVGYDNITLHSSAAQLRTGDTQLGNLIAKSNRWYADNLTSGITIDAAFREARGIGNGLAIGPIINADIQSVLPDNQSLAILQVTATELKSILEHSVALSSSTATPPRFLQVSGLRFTHDLDNKSRTVLDNGTVSENGTRITKIQLMYDNGTLRSSVFDNGTYDNESTNYRIVTTAFLANGGDLYPLTNLGNASRIDLDNGSYSSAGGSSFSGHGKEQDALAEYFKAYHDNETVAVTADSLDNYTRITAQ
jgi:2',3'-cyclic-nucleotide 2'-phosphodiesterase (5'-nucleotidase family)